jgi:hypothetical protein
MWKSVSIANCPKLRRALIRGKSPASDRMVARYTFLGRLGLLRVKVLPFLSPLQHKCFSILERFEDAFSLDHIARLTAGHEVLHFSYTAMIVRVNMVNGEDHPVRELVQAVQSAIPALKLITSKHLHRVFPRQVWHGPGEKLLELLQRHGSSSRTQLEQAHGVFYRALEGKKANFSRKSPNILSLFYSRYSLTGSHRLLID